MGLFDSVFSTFDNAVSGLFGSSSGSLLGGSNEPGYTFLPPLGYQEPVPQSYPMPAPVYQNVQMSPMVVAGGRMLMQRFPQLWAAIGALGQQFGRKFTPEMLWRMLRSNGPGMVGGLIGAAALNELAVWKTTHKGRRMNVANTRALRRSVRRLKGFDRLSHRVSAQLGRVAGRRRSVGRSRCSSCRKSPCAC
jgi:hypothetical protein